MRNDTYLVVPKRDLPRYLDPADRAYFAKPVRVELLYSDVATRLVWVRDPVRDHTYPACPQSLTPWYRLARKYTDG